ncbi:MAG: NAD-dependent epimerase/dehydratase family protein, partial [Myxococcales bacterium]|nr:NAD-dependent epimerase/dehydratase family protein [Myxococcales bacterium]
FWDPARGEVGPGLESVDAVVHLAGAPIAEHRWTDAWKTTVRDSRVQGTRTLARALAGLPPKVFVSTSAVGFYGDRGDEPLDEASPAGTGFLADVGRAWEAEVQPAVDAGWRVSIVRVGLVISTHGGILGPLLPMFRWGLGGPVGDGQQWMSWVHLDDLVAMFHWLLTSDHAGV